MTGQTAGRHRNTKRYFPPSPPSRLLIDHSTNLLGGVTGSAYTSRLIDGPAGRPFPGAPAGQAYLRPFPGDPTSHPFPGSATGQAYLRPFPGDATGRPFPGDASSRPFPGSATGQAHDRGFAGRRSTRRRFGGRASGRLSLGKLHVFGIAAPAMAAGVAVAIAAGYALPHSPGSSTGGHGALGPEPSASAPASASASASAPVTPSASPAAPATVRPHVARWTARPARAAGEVPAVASSPRTSASAAAPKPAIVVKYRVNSQGSSGFQGEVEVTDNGAQPISDWQIVVSLPGDEVVSVSNASGFVSNGTLLLQPAADAQPVPANGGTLRVFFIALGLQEVPSACAFDGISCQ